MTPSREARQPTLLAKLATILVTSIAALVGIEIALRFFAARDYYVWRPGLERLFEPTSAVMPGIEGDSRFSINSSGVRGDEFTPDQWYRILAFGGSTTECLYLDDRESWPYLLQEALNAGATRRGVWVGSVGKSGNATPHHVLQIEALLPQYPRIDAVILLIGVNDFHRRLVLDRNYRPYHWGSLESRMEIVYTAFDTFPGTYPGGSFFERTEIWRNASRVSTPSFDSAETGFIQGGAGAIYAQLRAKRRSARVIRRELPDLSTAIGEYSQNVNRIVDVAAKHGTRVILLTQPTLWKVGLREELRDLLWMGFVGRQAGGDGQYYSIDALERGMGVFNETLLAICRDRKIDCVDLASRLPKDTSVFYDDAHFNEGGARKVAEPLAAYLLDREPFR